MWFVVCQVKHQSLPPPSFSSTWELISKSVSRGVSIGTLQARGGSGGSKSIEKKKVTLITQHISGKFYTCFPLFFRKVEFQISLSALSRLLDPPPREEKQGMGMCYIQFLYSSMHIMSDTCDRMATICCWETSSVAHQHGSVSERKAQSDCETGKSQLHPTYTNARTLTRLCVRR